MIKRSVYREIGEDEIVVAQGAGGTDAGEAGEPPPSPDTRDTTEPSALDAIMLFLRDTGDAQPPPGLRDIDTAAQQPETLASDSGRRLQLLVDKLANIAGLPEDLRPDNSVLSHLYHSGNR